MTKRMMVRQGDVLLIPIVAPVKEVVAAAKKDARGVVLAEGETSGHHHAVFGRGCKLFAFRDTANAARVLVVGRAGAEVRVVGGESAAGVPRHHPVSLAPGAWEVRIQRAWSVADEARSRQVAD